MQKFMTSDEFGLAMFQAQTNYADISAFFGSDRRAGHRWKEDGPSNQVSRLVQLLCALNLTLNDARMLIQRGIEQSGTAVPEKVASIETQLERLRGGAQAARGGSKGSSNDRGPKNRAPKARQQAARAVG